MRRALACAGTFGTLAASAFACTVMNGLRTDPPAPIAAEDGAASCLPIHPPGRPPPSTAVDDPANDILVALRAIVRSDGDDPRSFDLDDRCTCAPDPPPCRSPSPTCDLDGGADNALRGLLETVSGLAGADIFQYAKTRIDEGKSGYLLRVEDYNGTSDDPAVTVSAYGSGGPNGTDGTRELPTFTGVQSWTVIRAHLASDAGAFPSRFSTREAYVSGDVLVATFDFPFLTAAPYDEPFHAATITAQIVRGEGGKPTLAAGTMTGRWRVEELFRSVAHVELSPGTPVCTQKDFTAAALSFICAAVDLPADPAAAATSTCDAVSFGVGFLAHPARFGQPVDWENVVDRCPPAAVECLR